MKYILLISLLFFLVSCEKKTSEQHLNNANEALNHQQFNVAIVELKNAAQLAPKNGEIRFLLGQTYVKLGKLKDAEKELERALENGYAANKVIPLLSKVYQQTGETKNLFKLSNKSKSLKSKDLAQLKFYQLQAYVDSGQEEKAQKLIQEIKQIPGGEEFKQLALIYDFILRQELDNALVQLEHVLLEYSNQPSALKLQAQLYLSTGQPELAVKSYQSYVDYYPNDHDAKFVLARLYSEIKQHDKAEPIIDELLKTYAEQPLLLQLKATARATAKDHQQALHFSERALSINPEETSSRLIAGISAYMLGDMDNANQHLSFIASALPADHLALRLLADTQLRLGQSLDANETIQGFQSLTEQDAGLMSQLGNSLLKAGEVNKAKAILAKQPDNIETAEVKANLALLKLSLNDISGIWDLETLLAQKQQDKNSSQLNALQLEKTLVNAYLSTGKYEKALEIAQTWQLQDDKAVKLNGYVTAAKAYTRLKNTEQAEVAYRSALDIEPNNPDVTLSLILIGKDDLNQKLQNVNRLLKTNPTHIPTILQNYIITSRLGHQQNTTKHIQSLIQDKSRSTHKDLTLVLGQIFLLENEPESSIRVFESIKTEQSEPFWLGLASAYVKTKQYNKASDLYKEWFTQEPNNSKAVIGMVKVHQVQRNDQKALELTEHYLKEVNANHLEITLLRLHLLARMQRFDLLENGLKELPTNVEQLPFVKGLNGHLHLSKGNGVDAEKGLRAFYQLLPSSSNAQLLYKAIYLAKDETAANNFLVTHIENHKSDVTIRMMLAQKYIAKDINAAIKQYRKIIEIEPKHFVAHNNLANLLSEIDKQEEAYKHGLKANELKPNVGAVLDTLGSIELKLNKNKAALEHMQLAIDLLKNNVGDHAMLNYIEALYRNDQNRLAERKAEQYSFKTESGKKRLQRIQVMYQ